MSQIKCLFQIEIVEHAIENGKTKLKDAIEKSKFKFLLLFFFNLLKKISLFYLIR